jgi:addiction module HigA family antidote
VIRYISAMARQNPGTTLLELFLKPKNISQNKLAKAIGVPPRRINEIILGKRAITADTALRLGYYFGNSPSYWMHLQSEHEIELAKEKIGFRLHMIQALHMDENILAASSETPPAEDSDPQKPSHNIKRRMMR